MKHRLHRLAGLMPVVALTGALLASPVGAQTTAQAQAWPPAASVPALQARMTSIRETTDPERRMALMEEQIKALDAASQGGPAACPMMGGTMMDPNHMQEHMQMMQQHMRMMKMHQGMPPAAPN